MTLYAIATKHAAHDYWAFGPRLFESRREAEAWIMETWSGVESIRARVVPMKCLEEMK